MPKFNETKLEELKTALSEAVTGVATLSELNGQIGAKEQAVLDAEKSLEAASKNLSGVGLSQAQTLTEIRSGLNRAAEAIDALLPSTPVADKDKVIASGASLGS